MIDPIHTGGAKIPETVHEAAELAAEIRMQCIERKLGGAGFTALADPDMEGWKERMKYTKDDLEGIIKYIKEELQVKLHIISEKTMQEHPGDTLQAVSQAWKLAAAVEILDEKRRVMEKAEVKR